MISYFDHRRRVRPAVFIVMAIVFAFSHSAADIGDDDGDKHTLPLPSSLSLDEYEELMFRFLRSGAYKTLRWKKDKSIRDTGPWLNNSYYGTHPAVRIYYSPGVMRWLRGGRKGSIPQNAMIIKEMYNPPAARYFKDAAITFREKDLLQDSVTSNFSGWVIMVKDTTLAVDGWFWGGLYSEDQEVDNDPFNYPNFGFGQYCVRCHASAEDELTFSTLNNIEGFAGNPLVYKNDGSWLDIDREALTFASAHIRRATDEDDPVLPVRRRAVQFNPEFVNFYQELGPIARDSVVPIPAVGYDHVIANPHKLKQQFITSDQCMSCHDGFGTDMYIPGSDGRAGMNVSPYGEWSWSMMGLAGRDPVFFAQQESEGILHPSRKEEIVNTCFRCHGVMGQRQNTIDSDGQRYFKEEFVYLTDQRSNPDATYGALARDGISCQVCHQIVDDGGGLDLSKIETGQFPVSHPDTVHGPFETVVSHPMEEALAIKPVYYAYVKSSRLCASCHTVNLPVYDTAGNVVKTHYEQTTYMEWVNSQYQNETGSIEQDLVKTCQDCHMPNTYHQRELEFGIATIQDETYPASENLAPIADITVRERKDFRRHTLLGINIFVLEMFNQFAEILGIQKYDFMPENSDGLPNAIANSNELAKKETAVVELQRIAPSDASLSVDVEVTNLTGHKFPSGVGFRRAFIELQLIDTISNTLLWASGRTNDLGVILDGEGRRLPSELFDEVNGKQAYEPHYDVITSQNQVQIYQEIALNTIGEITTSFMALDKIIKDNRLLPKGWSPKGPYAEHTAAEGKAEHDPLYQNGSGGDKIRYNIPLGRQQTRNARVVVSLYYQSIPPFYLHQRFATNRDGVYARDHHNTQRLYYLASNLNLKDTPVENWKLLVAADSSPVP